MTFAAWLTAIGLPPAAQAAVFTHPITLARWQALLPDRTAFLSTLTASPQQALAVFARLQYADRARYATTAEWVADGRDLALWAADYAAHHPGASGVTECDWLWLTATHQVVRLGRLQFQPWQLTQPVGGFAAGTATLQVHIPADGPLAPAACDAAFAQAKARFGARPLLCDSWLLSPALQALLPATSNIRQFQALFRVVSTAPAAHQAEERLFGTWAADKTTYPTRTSLQRAAKAWLLQGKPIGMALGVAEWRGREVGPAAWSGDAE